MSETGCWLWQRRLTNGYGHIRTGSRRTIRGERRAHLVAYELYVGPIPEGLQLDHTCHTEAVLAGTCAGGDDCVHRRCVNPGHLEPVTPAENTRRSGENCVANVNRGKTHCVHGHEFNPENTRTRRGKRECRQCGREQDAARKRAARALQADHDGEPSPSRCGSTRRHSGVLGALHPNDKNPGRIGAARRDRGPNLTGE